MLGVCLPKRLSATDSMILQSRRASSCYMYFNCCKPEMTPENRTEPCHSLDNPRAIRRELRCTRLCGQEDDACYLHCLAERDDRTAAVVPMEAALPTLARPKAHMRDGEAAVGGGVVCALVSRQGIVAHCLLVLGRRLAERVWFGRRKSLPWSQSRCAYSSSSQSLRPQVLHRSIALATSSILWTTVLIISGDIAMTLCCESPADGAEDVDVHLVPVFTPV